MLALHDVYYNLARITIAPRFPATEAGVSGARLGDGRNYFSAECIQIERGVRTRHMPDEILPSKSESLRASAARLIRESRRLRRTLVRMLQEAEKLRRLDPGKDRGGNGSTL
jgi:hypothetical protein